MTSVGVVWPESLATMILMWSSAWASWNAARAEAKAISAPGSGQLGSRSPLRISSDRFENRRSMLGPSNSSRIPGMIFAQSSRQTLALTFGSPRSDAAASWASLIVLARAW